MTLRDVDELAVKVETAAALIECGRSTGYELVKRGEWPVIRVGSEMRVLISELRRWASRQRRRIPPGSTRARSGSRKRA